MSQWKIFEPSLEGEYARAINELLKRDGEEVAKKCGVIYLPPRSKRGRGRFIVNLLTKTYSVELDRQEIVDLIAGREIRGEIALLIARYLCYSSGGGRKEDWIPYDRFPGSKQYRSLFDRYVIRPFARSFGYDPERYKAVCKRLGGKRERLGGLSYSFNFLPRVRILTQLWKAKREDYIPPTANLSFNHSARYYLSVRDLFLAGRIMVELMEAEARKLEKR